MSSPSSKNQGAQSFGSPTKKWIAKKFSQDFDAPPGAPSLLVRLLQSRNFKSWDEVLEFVNPKLQSMKDPMCLLNMRKAVARLLEAREKDQCVAVYADFDLDGSSGLALLHEGLKRLGFKKLLFYQPRRLSEGYGLHASAIEELAQLGADVVVTVDVGITGFEAAIKARELGIDLIITDHHLAKSELPEAFAIINPNQNDCPSGLGYLSGAGVAFYLVLALRKTLTERGEKFDWNPKLLLDLFVIGTLTDLVPLVNENRTLVKHGLHVLSQTKRVGLRALLDYLEMNNRLLTSTDVAMGLAPKLNALTRMDLGLLPRDIYFVEDKTRAEEMIINVLENNSSRKKLQEQAEREAFENFKGSVKNGFVWSFSKNYHKGVIGLVATKLAQELGVCAFVGSISEESIVTGSCRRPDGCDHLSLVSALEKASESLIRFGGHAPAAGFALQLENEESFARGLESYFSQTQLNQNVAKTYDVECNFSEISADFINWLESLEPFGSEFEIPIFYSQSVRVEDCVNLKGGHLRLHLSQAQHRQNAIYFSPPQDLNLSVGDNIDLIYQIQKNHYQGRSRLQLLVKDLRLSI